MFTAELDPADFRAFARTLEQLSYQLDRPLEDLLREQGRLLARDLAHHVQPYGLSPATGRAFRQTVADSVNRFYKPVGWLHDQLRRAHGQNVADHLVRLIRTGRLGEAQTLLNGRVRLPASAIQGAVTVGPFDGGALHRRHRWHRRTIRRHPLHIVTDWPAAKTYIDQTISNTGLAKAALVNAGRDLDGKDVGVPAWIKKHATAPGRGTLTRNGRRGFVGIIQSFLSYAREALPLAQEIRAIDFREAQALKRLEGATDYNLRRAMSRGAGAIRTLRR